jgi:uncharacterized protein (TIGR02594 family)
MALINWLKSLFKKEVQQEVKPEIKIEAVAPVKIEKNNTPWMDVAYGEMGEKEIPGSKDNPRILEYFKATSYKATDDETPWCSAFIAWCFSQCNMRSTKSARAASWLDWGYPMDRPQYGCVVVKSRPLNGNPTGGNHVTFYVKSEMKDGVPGFVGLGGNQQNKVSVMWYPLKTVRGFRWPKDAK